MNEIKIYRGNTMSFEIDVSISDEIYALQDDDKVILTVKTNSCVDTEPIIKKVLTSADYDESNRLIITFTPNDTKDKQPFTYYYDCALQLASGEFYTFISKSLFTILETLSEKEVKTS